MIPSTPTDARGPTASPTGPAARRCLAPACLALVAGLAGTGGCAENAILEMELVAPAASDGCDVAAVAIEAEILPEGPCVFESAWAASPALLPLAESPTPYPVSVVAEPEDVGRPLCLRIRRCAAGAECPSPDPLVGLSTTVELERPFHRGRFTRWSLTLPDPCGEPIALDVGRCEIAGCDDDPDRTSWCRPDGTHLCE